MSDLTDLVTQSEVEERFTPIQLQRLYIDDGGNAPGTAFATAIKSASRRAAMILKAAGWDAESIYKLVSDDDALKDAVCDMVMHFGTKRRTEWYVDGTPPFQAVFKEAVAMFKEVAQANVRPISEEDAGQNQMWDERINANEDPEFVFANGAESGY